MWHKQTTKTDGATTRVAGTGGPVTGLAILAIDTRSKATVSRPPIPATGPATQPLNGMGGTTVGFLKCFSKF